VARQHFGRAGARPTRRNPLSSAYGDSIHSDPACGGQIGRAAWPCFAGREPRRLHQMRLAVERPGPRYLPLRRSAL